MMNRLTWCALAGLMLRVSVCVGTDVAFWNQYHAGKDDAGTMYLLLGFDEEPVAGVGAVDKVELTGAAALAKEGRFGGALQLDGKSAARCLMNQTFAGGQISMEAWVRLERYPTKSAYILYRPAAVDRSAKYDPKVDVSKGFALSVDKEGALHMDITNIFYGSTTRTSSKAGCVPLERWVHVAGIAGPGRKLYIDGKLVADLPVHWGQGLEVQGERESQAQPIYIGNSEKGDAGLTALIDQVRVHRNVQAFWAPEDLAWTDPEAKRAVASAPPHFVARHAPVAVVPLDGSGEATGPAKAKVELGKGEFVPGVRGKAFAGRIAVSAPGIFDSAEGSVEFWLRPVGVNSLSDRNRTFLNEPFNFYLLNGGTHEPTLYFGDPEMGLHFVHAPLEFHPARWFHCVFTWRGPDIRIFIDGQPVGRTYGRSLINNGKTKADRFVFNGHETIGLLDEIRIYDRALLPAEAANAYWRYRDPSKLTTGVTLPAVEIAAEYLPADHKIFYELSPRIDRADITEVTLELRDSAGKKVQSWPCPWSEKPAGEVTLPALADGEYVLATVVKTITGAMMPGGEFPFYCRAFAWEKNTLGITGEVFAPFEPVTVKDRTIGVVGRTMTVNAFGLWDQVNSAEVDLLAGPMCVRYQTPGGEGRLDAGTVHVTRATDNLATVETSIAADAIGIATRSGVEIDGCMKVQMTLVPGKMPGSIDSLWIEIPLRDQQAPLMHTIADGLRQNHAGAVPAGDGIVWDGSKAHRAEKWRNMFVPYVWLGSANRGLAFFAENDNGWVTQKNRSRTPTHEIRRENGRLILRVYLINTPTTIRTPRQLVFGLQASPTKPMPPDWRKKLPLAPGGLAVVPWGGIQCASQGPYADDWMIVDKILQARAGKPFDEAWLKQYVEQHHPPRVHNDSDWAYYVGYFVSRAKSVGMDKPIAVYQEEMRAAHSRPEWIVYQDQWKTTGGPAARTQPGGLDLRGGHRSFSEISTINFSRSYADFGVWMADQWLSRGVSLYWDNTYLYPTYNPRTSAAYLAEDGYIQPALTIWNVRAYHQRVWNVLQQRRRQRAEPLEWTLHMTNTLVLPVHTWGTVNLDHELGVKQPFSPEWLMTEAIGLQVGNLPLSLYEVAGRDNARFKSLPASQRTEIEWAMRAVHEIQRSGPDEKLLEEFGYAGADVTIHHYWDDQPVLSVQPASVKWLALQNRRTGQWLIVLASWSEEAITARVDLKNTGLKGHTILDARTGQPLGQVGDQPFAADLAAPWGSRVLKLERPGD